MLRLPKIVSLALLFLSLTLNLYADNSVDADIKLERVLIESDSKQDFQSKQSASASQANWSMHQYNSQHTGFNDYSTISVPLYLQWSITDTLTLIKTVTVIDDKVLFTYGRKYKNMHSGCFNAKDGSLAWLWYLGDISSATPPSYGLGNVFVQVTNSSSSYMAAFDLNSGDTAWLKPLSAQWQVYLAPTFHKDRLLFGSGTYGGLYCFDAADGTHLWNTPGTRADEWTPAAHGNLVYAYVEKVFTLWDLNTGENLWRFFVDLPGKAPGEQSLGMAMGVSPVVDTIDNIVYCMDAFYHMFYAIDMEQRQILWTDSAVFHGYGKNPVLYNDLLIVTQWGYVDVYDRFTGEVLWKFEGDGGLIYTPVVANGYLFVSSLDSTFAVNISTQSVEWSYPAGGFLTVTDKNLYVADSVTGSLYAFGDITTDIEDEHPPELPTDFVLHQNYPNPFNPSTEIKFEIPSRSFVEVSVYNTLGQKVKTLVNAEKSAGSHTAIWNGTDESGNTVSSGTYFYKLTAGDFIASKKMMLIK